MTRRRTGPRLVGPNGYLTMLSFSTMIGLGAVLGHSYLYFRLVRRLVVSTSRRRAILVFFALMTTLLVMRFPLRALGTGGKTFYELVGYSWLALLMCMTAAVAAGDVVLAALFVARRVFRRAAAPSPAALPREEAAQAATPPDATSDLVESPARRRVLQAVPWGVLAGGGVTAAYGTYRAFTAPELTEVVLPIPRLPPTLEGISIVQLTDIHVGSFIGEGFLDMLVESTNAAKADAVVITGDLVDGGVRELGDAVATLAGIRSRFGTFFVTGNHEYYSDEREWVPFLERLGMRVLRNERAAIGDGGGHFDLVGVDDWSGGRRRSRQFYDLDAALEGRDEERAAVLLAHQPANFEVAASRGIDLQISGHTHGGQVFPMSHLVAIRHPYHRGLDRHGDSRIDVSRGCGVWGPPSRVDSPPELVRYVLTRG